MSSSLIQVRVDESIRNEANEIFHNLGMDMSSAVRLFLNRVILSQGLPFPMRLQNEDQTEKIYEIPLSQPTPSLNSSEYLQSLAENNEYNQSETKFDASKFLMDYIQNKENEVN